MRGRYVLSSESTRNPAPSISAGISRSSLQPPPIRFQSGLRRRCRRRAHAPPPGCTVVAAMSGRRSAPMVAQSVYASYGTIRLQMAAEPAAVARRGTTLMARRSCAPLNSSIWKISPDIILEASRAVGWAIIVSVVVIARLAKYSSKDNRPSNNTSRN